MSSGHEERRPFVCASCGAQTEVLVRLPWPHPTWAGTLARAVACVGCGGASVALRSAVAEAEAAERARVRRGMKGALGLFFGFFVWVIPVLVRAPSEALGVLRMVLPFTTAMGLLGYAFAGKRTPLGPLAPGTLAMWWRSERGEAWTPAGTAWLPPQGEPRGVTVCRALGLVVFALAVWDALTRR